jgi:hypothetical protein
MNAPLITISKLPTMGPLFAIFEYISVFVEVVLQVGYDYLL